VPSAAAIIALADAEGQLAVRATANAREDAIALPQEGEPPVLHVRTRTAPESGRANEAILAMISGALGRPRSSLELLRGGTSRNKLIRIPTC